MTLLWFFLSYTCYCSVRFFYYYYLYFKYPNRIASIALMKHTTHSCSIVSSNLAFYICDFVFILFTWKPYIKVYAKYTHDIYIFLCWFNTIGNENDGKYVRPPALLDISQTPLFSFISNICGWEPKRLTKKK